MFNIGASAKCAFGAKDESHTAQDTLRLARFDGAKNTKFNIAAAAAATASEGRADGRTYMDALSAELRGVCAVDDAEAEAAFAVEAFVTAHAFDTESIKLDLRLCDANQNSNLLAAVRGSAAALKDIKGFVRTFDIAANSFSTGIPFLYWDSD